MHKTNEDIYKLQKDFFDQKREREDIKLEHQMKTKRRKYGNAYGGVFG